jgi:hypothetical protein
MKPFESSLPSTGMAHTGISAEDRQGRYNGVGWKNLGGRGLGSSSQVGWRDIPSGKRLRNYGKSQFLMGKSTINGHFQ